MEAYGTRVGAANASEVYRIRIGSNGLTGAVASILTGALSTSLGPYYVSGTAKVRSAGATGSCAAMIIRQTSQLSTNGTMISAFGGTTAVDTTQSITVALTFSSGNSSNTYTFRTATLTRVA
jgi:hypothetical protein